MKKKLIFLLVCIILISASGWVVASTMSNEENDDSIKIVTSFYPMYLLANNIAQGAKGVEVVNLTNYETGCLHDYQLTTSDMKKLEGTDVFIMNGGGMESFLDDILGIYSNIEVIDSSEGISLLEATDYDRHEGDHGDHDHSHDYNAHIWMNMDSYIKQIENIQHGLSKIDKVNDEIYESNSKKYIREIRKVQSDYKTRLAEYKDIPLIIFHDAFAYLADEMGLNVVHIVNIDENTYLSAGQLGEVIDIINNYDVNILLTEAQYSVNIAKTIADETDTKVYIADSIVSGDYHNDAYIEAMMENLEVIERAFAENRGYNE